MEFRRSMRQPLPEGEVSRALVGREYEIQSSALDPGPFLHAFFHDLAVGE